VNVTSIVTYCAKPPSFGIGATAVWLGAKQIVVRETVVQIDELIKNARKEMIQAPNPG
jgi:hypothetical protein